MFNDQNEYDVFYLQDMTSKTEILHVQFSTQINVASKNSVGILIPQDYFAAVYRSTLFYESPKTEIIIILNT